jgi:hypothetical protein
LAFGKLTAAATDLAGIAAYWRAQMDKELSNALRDNRV